MRLIDADALKEKSYWECYSDPDDDYEYVLVTDIDRAPTIDVVEVVRCKDCAYSEGFPWSACPMLGIVKLKDDDFCSRGERRTDAN